MSIHTEFMKELALLYTAAECAAKCQICHGSKMVIQYKPGVCEDCASMDKWGTSWCRYCQNSRIVEKPEFVLCTEC